MIFWGYGKNMGFQTRCYEPFSHYITSVRVVTMFSAGSRTCFRWMLAPARVVPYHQSCLWFSWTGRRSQGRPRTCRRDYISHLVWEHTLGSPRTIWKTLHASRMSGLPCLTCCHHNLTLFKQHRLSICSI